MAEGASPSIQAATPSAIYGDRIARFEQEREHLQHLWERYGNARLVAFFAMFGIAVVARYEQSWLIAAAIVPAFVVFVALVRKHRSFRRQLDRARLMLAINREEMARLSRDFNQITLRRPLQAPTQHAYARDLDILGPNSLQHLIDTTQTWMGADRLASWLSGPAASGETVSRQIQVRELAPLLDWRQELHRRGRERTGRDLDPEPLLTWCESAPMFGEARWLRPLALSSPALLILLGILSIVGAAPGFLIAIPLAVNLWLFSRVAGGRSELIGTIAESTDGVGQYSGLLEHVETLPHESELRQQVHQRLSRDGESAAGWVRRLQRRAAFAIPPTAILYFPTQVLLNWNLNVLLALEAWKLTVGKHVRDWLELIGELEALSAFAGLAFNQPEWAFATIDPQAQSVSARGLGHPLLPDVNRVPNDVQVGPPGTVLLVTGSNMSGKSTLLRSVGINAVLAMAGAPMCADSLTMPPVRVWTSVRVEDSVVSHVSFYMAELLRLKSVVDASKSDEARQLYLLDEILQGTNTAERQIAARTIIRALIDSGAIGAVSTHDLDLARGPELEERTTLVHFRDDVTREGLSFDYVLRPGLATSTNALKLMEFVFGTDAGLKGEA